MINFNKFFRLFNILSVVLIICSILLLIFKGLNFGIDFKGGTLIELRTNDKNINVSSLRDTLNTNIYLDNWFVNWFEVHFLNKIIGFVFIPTVFWIFFS